MREEGNIYIWMGVFIAILALPVLASGHSGHSAEEVVVRLSAVDAGTYTFSCDVPDDAATPRTWSVRKDSTGEELHQPLPQTEEATFSTDKLTEQELYHIGCQTNRLVDGEYVNIRGDFHIDLRPEDQRTIKVHSSEATTIDMTCRPQEDASGASWLFLDASTGESYTLEGEQRISHTVPEPGLWDVECHANGQHAVLPVEFFESGPAYVPNSEGCVPGHGCAGDGTTDENQTVPDDNQTSPDTNETQDSSDTNQTDGACTSELKDLTATCEGTITSDTFDGCRHVTCENGGESIQLMACDKPDEGEPERFEMYLHAATDNPPSVCLGGTCIQDEGFASTQYPVCTEADNTSAPEDNETSPPVDDTNDNQTINEFQVCHESVTQLPASCEGGAIVEDSNTGSCRTLRCESGDAHLEVMACDKPDGQQAQYFEMYKKSGDGQLDICIGDTCLDGWGFRRGGDLPVCTQEETQVCTAEEAPVCGVDGNTYSNECHAKQQGVAVDYEGVCQDDTQTCYSSLAELPVTCSSGSVVEDEDIGGCRAVTCADGDQSTSVLACEKPDEGPKEFFEMYKKSGGAVEVCLGSTCLQDAGYTKSGAFPVCSGTGSSGDSLAAPTGWVAPGADADPTFLHLELTDAANSDLHASSDFEVWSADGSERVWSANGITAPNRYHVHGPDGTFENSRAGTGQLAHDTQYQARVRYKDTSGSYTQWSDWRVFTTRSADTGGSGGSDEPQVSGDWQAPDGYVVEEFASGFDVPVHVAAAPAGMYDDLPDYREPWLYVTELYGTVKVVFKDGSTAVFADDLLNFDPFGSITGGGQMGLVGLYVDESTGDVFVSTVYMNDAEEIRGKVVRFAASSDGSTYTDKTTISDDWPSAPSHQVQQVTRGPEGKLYIGLGDALEAGNAQDDSTLAGKVVRFDEDGSNLEVFAKGLRNPFGMDWRPGYGQLFATDNAPNSGDTLYQITEGGNYMWPCQNAPCNDEEALADLGVSPVDVEFGSDPSTLFVAVGGPIYYEGVPSNGKHILEFTLDGDGKVVGQREFVKYVGDGYGTPIGMDFGPDGLYFTDIYGEAGFVGLGETEASIYRVRPGNGEVCSSCDSGELRAGISIEPWYPKDQGDFLEYIFKCKALDGTGGYDYKIDYGDGSQTGFGPQELYYKTYPDVDQDFTVTCTVRDGAGAQASRSMTINPADFIAEQ